MNTFGRYFRFTSFGESHGVAIGGVIDGMPGGVAVDTDFVQRALARRRPGNPELAGASARRETDELRFLSGIYAGRTLGTPIAFLIENRDARSADYAALAACYRPSHADDTYEAKYGWRDARGGGRASARETAARVAAGALAQCFLKTAGVQVYAYTEQIGGVRCTQPYTAYDLARVYEAPLYCPALDAAAAMETELARCMADGDTVGGCVRGVIRGLPKGCGEPVYDKLTARLASAMMGINAARGFEIGMGFAAAAMRGSAHNDMWTGEDAQGVLRTERNLCGGVRGGIGTGEDIWFRVAFKPIATLGQPVGLWHKRDGLREMCVGGRHDVCCVPRAVPV
ncbi:MAG: chorismate synthase, partial [Bacteroidales bacterium]|nr:chorismate synthase [Bacteroidales bacterium]